MAIKIVYVHCTYVKLFHIITVVYVVHSTRIVRRQTKPHNEVTTWTSDSLKLKTRTKKIKFAQLHTLKNVMQTKQTFNHI